MNVLSCDQGSAEWFYARSGKVTASQVIRAISFLKIGDKKGGETAARASLKVKIVAEILSGEPSIEGYVSPYMQYGTEMEPFARAAYEVKFDTMVDKVGFVLHPTIERAGGSPDGLIGDQGGIEIKCPKTETHLDYMIAGVLPPEYEPQVMFCLACTGRTWWDFASFDARLPARHQLFVVRVLRDEERIQEIEEGVRAFLFEVDEMIAQIEQINPEIPTKIRQEEDFGDLGITDADINDWMNVYYPDEHK
jgi:hypothetical protein